MAVSKVLPLSIRRERMTFAGYSFQRIFLM